MVDMETAAVDGVNGAVPAVQMAIALRVEITIRVEVTAQEAAQEAAQDGAIGIKRLFWLH